MKDSSNNYSKHINLVYNHNHTFIDEIDEVILNFSININKRMFNHRFRIKG